MRFNIVGLAAALACLAPFVGAQSTGSSDISKILEQMTKEVPPCALNCILSEVPKSTCPLTDFACVCTNAGLQEKIVACLQTNCTVTEQLQTQKFQMSSCGIEVRNIGPSIKGVIWGLYSVAVFAVVCRLIARLPALGGQYAWDDYTIIMCLLALTPCSVIAHMMVNHGLGQDIWMLSPDDITNTLFYFFVEMFHYTFLVVFTKISILFLYLRIFTTRAFSIQCYCMIGVIAAFGISCVVTNGLFCAPLSLMWTQWDGEHAGTCINLNAQTYAAAGINMALDIIVFLLPIPQVIRLQMSWKKKAGVALMFTVGLFVTLCSAVRLQTILQWGKSMNPTYDYSNLALWSLVEIDVGVICACMPGVAVLLRRILPKVFGTTKGDSHKYPKNSKNSSVNSSGRFGRVNSPKKIINKTTSVSVSYDAHFEDASRLDSKSDEFELIDREAGLSVDREQQGSRIGKHEPGHETRTYRSNW